MLQYISTIYYYYYYNLISIHRLIITSFSYLELSCMYTPVTGHLSQIWWHQNKVLIFIDYYKRLNLQKPSPVKPSRRTHQGRGEEVTHQGRGEEVGHETPGKEIQRERETKEMVYTRKEKKRMATDWKRWRSDCPTHDLVCSYVSRVGVCSPRHLASSDHWTFSSWRRPPMVVET